MQIARKYLNKLVNVSVTNKIGHISTLSGFLTTISHEFFIVLDQDKAEHIFRKKDLHDIKIISDEPEHKKT